MLVEVVCPEGVSPGDTISVASETSTFDVVVPDGIAPGSAFQVELPEPSAGVAGDDGDGGRQSRRGETRDEESDEEGEVFRECVRVACIIILFSEARDGGTLGRLGPVVPTVVFFSSLPIV